MYPHLWHDPSVCLGSFLPTASFLIFPGRELAILLFVSRRLGTFELVISTSLAPALSFSLSSRSISAISPPLLRPFPLPQPPAAPSSSRSAARISALRPAF